MSKYKLTTLTPVHISSADEYELHYNLLEKDDFVYLYDEFRIAEFFIANNMQVPSNINELKRVIQQKSDEIIKSNLHLRKIECKFSKITKPLLTQITTADNPIITGSSVKGSLRTAILDNLYSNYKESDPIKKLMKDKKLTKDRLSNYKGRVPYDNDLSNIFKYLKVTDSLLPLETQVYKTINMKKDKNYQRDRENKVEEIANYIEAIKPNQSFEIEIKDIHEDQIFQNLAKICNKFYIPFFADDAKQYFAKNTEVVNRARSAGKSMFIVNVGRFSGAERKSLNNIRDIKASKAYDKSTTSARTFALEKDVNDRVYFENQLLPFGWIICEKMDKKLSQEYAQWDKEARKKLSQNIFDKFEAIEKLKMKQSLNAEILLKEKEEKIQKEEAEKRALQEAENQRREILFNMSPAEKIINSFGGDIAKIINAMRADKIENLKEIKEELAKKLKEKMQKDPKQWEKAKQKALKRREYIEEILKG